MYMKTITEFYEAPVTIERELETEGVLCASLKDTAVEDFYYKEFEW